MKHVLSSVAWSPIYVGSPDQLSFESGTNKGAFTEAESIVLVPPEGSFEGEASHKLQEEVLFKYNNYSINRRTPVFNRIMILFKMYFLQF